MATTPTEIRPAPRRPPKKARAYRLSDRAIEQIAAIAEHQMGLAHVRVIERAVDDLHARLGLGLGGDGAKKPRKKI